MSRSFLGVNMKTTIHAVIVATALPFALAGPSVADSPGPGEPTLAEVRAVTEKYQDVNVALAEGYIRDPADMCETADMMGRPASQGAMGVHYFRPDMLGITEPVNSRINGNGTHTDFRAPAILIYEPQSDGSMQLVAVENLVFQASWAAAGHSSPPTFHGVPYDNMQDDPATTADEAHNFQPHFDRHVWIYRENPAGVFYPLNPAVSCEHHGAKPAAETAAAK
jgi:hypothetical protein